MGLEGKGGTRESSDPAWISEPLEPAVTSFLLMAGASFSLFVAKSKMTYSCEMIACVLAADGVGLEDLLRKKDLLPFQFLCC
ncbi:hypothetical protein HAX54_041006, partial [Datura stramonium]|nr:hypothetical protein [Datura stramonium]